MQEGWGLRDSIFFLPGNTECTRGRAVLGPLDLMSKFETSSFFIFFEVFGGTEEVGEGEDKNEIKLCELFIYVIYLSITIHIKFLF